MAQTQLNQIIALEKGVKSRAHADVVSRALELAKAPLLSGISRTYRPKDDEGEQLPPESTRVQLRATEVLADVQSALTRLFDVTLTKDVANGAAKADLVVDGRTLAPDLPVTYLLFLEKQLSELGAFLSRLPVLDPSETWTFDETADCYATTASQTTRSKKVPRNHVKADATDKHPAQVEMYFEDVLVGILDHGEVLRRAAAGPGERAAGTRGQARRRGQGGPRDGQLDAGHRPEDRRQGFRLPIRVAGKAPREGLDTSSDSS